MKNSEYLEMNSVCLCRKVLQIPQAGRHKYSNQWTICDRVKAKPTFGDKTFV